MEVILRTMKQREPILNIITHWHRAHTPQGRQIQHLDLKGIRKIHTQLYVKQQT